MMTMLCTNCQHLTYDTDVMACRAFPAGIPKNILKGVLDHRQPIDGDHGYQYSPIIPDFYIGDADEVLTEDLS